MGRTNDFSPATPNPPNPVSSSSVFAGVVAASGGGRSSGMVVMVGFVVLEQMVTRVTRVRTGMYDGVVVAVGRNGTGRVHVRSA